MTTLATVPTYPVPNRETQVVFTLTGTGSNFVRAWVTISPEGSLLAEKLKTSTQNRFKLYEGDGGPDNPLRFTFDKGGKYTLVVQEYVKGSGFGGGYQGDPNGATSETKVGTETTLALFLGQKWTGPIGAPPDTATIVLWVWDATIRATTIATHGEQTPAIVATSPTARAKGAMEASLVQTKLALLAETAAVTARGDINVIVADIQTRLNLHNAEGSTIHFAADTDNVIKASLGSATTTKELPAFVNNALQLMRRHRTNDHGGKTGVTPEAPGVESATYHKVGGQFAADFTNMPLFQGVGGIEDAYGALADIWRAHEGHRLSLEVHGTQDGTNALATLPKLLEVHRRFLDVLAALSPPAAPAQSDGGIALLQAGFTEA